MLALPCRVVADLAKPAERPALFRLSSVALSVLTLTLLAVGSGRAQSPGPTVAARGDAHVLFLSDIHFEPFRDPGKVHRLAAAPVDRWDEILAAPPAPDQQQQFDALGEACHAKGTDTSYSLFHSGLSAMRAQAAGAALIMISGDLITHEFACKYKKVDPEGSAEDYRRFVEKTIDFVLQSIRHDFPGVPVYAALGNNDTDCDDYRIDAGGDFLGHESALFTGDLPDPQRQTAERTFGEGGFYAVELPAPFVRTRLLVFDDLFMARKYESCAGKPDAQEAGRTLLWLRRELTEARQSRERVWVMGHIPPGINPVSTVLKMRNVCAGQSPEMFLSSPALPDTLAEFGDVIELAVFGHTHMDEMRMLPHQGPEGHDVPVKLIPSISPVDGNTPSFTVAEIETATAHLRDYQVFAASNPDGADVTWQPEYRYSQAYRKPSFSSAEVDQLMTRFTSDPAGATPESDRYLKSYFVSDRSWELRIFWPQYTCALANYTEDAYRSCVCAEGKNAAPAP